MRLEKVGKERAKALLRVIAILIVTLGVAGFWQERSRPTGILSWLTGPIFDLAGSTGISVYYIIVGVCLLVVLGLKKRD